MTHDLASPSDGARDDLGRFKPGFGGRKPGSRNKVSRAALTAVQDLSSEAIMHLRDRMREGDLAAIKYILDATLPRGGRTIDLESSEPNSLIDAATCGDISPDEFARFAQGWKTAGDAADLQDLKAQVIEMELLISALRK